MSDLKGVPKKVILTSNEQAYPTDLLAYADLLIRNGRVVKDRHGVANRAATPQEVADAKTLTPEEAKVLLDESAWRGEPPAEGTRRRIILDAIAKGDVLSGTEALEIADTVELALLGSGDSDAVTDRICDEIEAACDVLDQLDVPQERDGAHLDLGARVTVLGDQLVAARREIVDAGNELDRISIARADDERRTLTLPERTKEVVRRLLTEEEAKRLLASTIDAQAQLRDNPHLPPEARERIEKALGIPPEGSRARLIYDTLLHEKVLLADGVAREHTLLDRSSVAKLAAVLEARINDSALAQVADPGRAIEGKVRPGTRELRIVLERISHPQAPPEFRFIELEDQDGAGVGGFPVREGERNPFYEITIPYGRDDAWVSEVAYQVAGAATRPLLEDHPDYVFPSERVRDAVAELLSDFGIPRACVDCAEEQIGHGAKEVDQRRDATIKQLEADVERFLGEREEARAGESRFAEERDCAFALLRWLLPVTVAKRLD